MNVKFHLNPPPVSDQRERVQNPELFGLSRILPNYKTVLRNIILIFLLGTGLMLRLWILSKGEGSYVYFKSDPFFSVAAGLVNGLGFNLVRPLAPRSSWGGYWDSPQLYKTINKEAGTVPFIINPPGYPLLTAITWKTFGYTVFPILYFQVFLTCLCFFLIYRIIAQIFNPAVGLLALFLTIFFNPNELFFTTTYWRDIYPFYATVISFYFFSQAFQADSWSRERRNYIYAGLAVGIGTLFRATVFLLPVFYAFSLPIRKTLKQSAKGLVVMMGMTLLCQIPWAVRNYLVFDRVILTHLGSGHSMMGGIGQVPNSLDLVCNDHYIRVKIQQYAYNRKLRGEKNNLTKTPVFDKNTFPDKEVNVPYMTLPYEVSAGRLVSEYRKNQPYTYFRLMLNQMWLGLIHDYDFHAMRYKDYPKPLRLQQLRFFNQVGILALCGFLLTLPGWRRTLHLATIPLYFITTIAMFYITGRHFIPMEFVYLTYTAFLFYSLYRGGVRLVKWTLLKHGTNHRNPSV